MKSRTTALADMLAMGIFLSTTALITRWYDLWLIGIQGKQWLFIHLSCGALKILGGYWCAHITDYIRFQILGNSEKTFRRCIADGLSVSAIQVVTYVALYATSGFFWEVGWKHLWVAIPIYALDGLLLGSLYGWLLNGIRRLLGVYPHIAPSPLTPIPHAAYGK